MCLRPRQAEFGSLDCVMVCFQEITGIREDLKSATMIRFLPYLNGEPGVSSEALKAVLKEVGWKLSIDERNEQFVKQHDGHSFLVGDPHFAEHWKTFQGQGVLFCSLTEVKAIPHAVVVRTGGIVFDPDRAAPEEGEFIVDHLKRRSALTLHVLFRAEQVDLNPPPVDLNARLRQFMPGPSPIPEVLKASENA